MRVRREPRSLLRRVGAQGALLLGWGRNPLVDMPVGLLHTAQAAAESARLYDRKIRVLHHCGSQLTMREQNHTLQPNRNWDVCVEQSVRVVSIPLTMNSDCGYVRKLRSSIGHHPADRGGSKMYAPFRYWLYIF